VNPTTSLPYQYRRLDDIETWQEDSLYRNLTADHSRMTVAQLQNRADKCRLLATDALTYGIRRAAVALRIADHATSLILEQEQEVLPW